MLKVTMNPPDFGEKVANVNIKRSMTDVVAIVTKRMEAEGKKTVTEMVYQSPPAASGYKRTGYLRNSIMSESRGLMGKVEAFADYAIYVHEGTRFMRGRPFFDKAVERQLKVLPKELAKKLDINIEKELT